MPTLDFAHKHIVERHHEQVPFRLLQPHPRKGYGENGKSVPGLPGCFTYNTLDKPLFNPIRIVTKARLNTVITELKARGRT